MNGIACGGGFELVLGTDIIVMEEHAKFALPEINVAVLADAAAIKLRRRIPYHVAVEFLMTGRWMDAAEAKHWGMANHVVPQGQALTKAREIARQLADGPPLLYPAIKQLLRHTEMVAEHEAFKQAVMQWRTGGGAKQTAEEEPKNNYFQKRRSA